MANRKRQKRRQTSKKTCGRLYVIRPFANEAGYAKGKWLSALEKVGWELFDPDEDMPLYVDSPRARMCELMRDEPDGRKRKNWYSAVALDKGWSQSPCARALKAQAEALGMQIITSESLMSPLDAEYVEHDVLRGISKKLRPINFLVKAGVSSAEQFLAMSEEDLSEIPDIGVNQYFELIEIQKKLARALAAVAPYMELDGIRPNDQNVVTTRSLSLGMLSYQHTGLTRLLRGKGFWTLGDVIDANPADLLAIYGAGPGALKAVDDALVERGLHPIYEGAYYDISSNNEVESYATLASSVASDYPFELNLFEDVCLPYQPAAALARAGIVTVGDLVDKTEEELLEVRDFGPISLAKLKYRLEEMGILDKVLDSAELDRLLDEVFSSEEEAVEG